MKNKYIYIYTRQIKINDFNRYQSNKNKSNKNKSNEFKLNKYKSNKAKSQITIATFTRKGHL